MSRQKYDDASKKCENYTDFEVLCQKIKLSFHKCIILCDHSTLIIYKDYKNSRNIENVVVYEIYVKETIIENALFCLRHETVGNYNYIGYN